ncbi:MAG: hypothetical protein Q4G09_02250 [Clostridia bacterium]|nr:hypothetical protein [Clostridia bacterium]
MKEKFVNLKNKVTAFIVANNKLFIIGLISFVLIVVFIIFLINKTEVGNTSINLNNFGFSVEKGKSIYYLGFNKGESDGIYKLKR